jgi:DNA (cytosine-5)-methyltransferase 1
MSIHGGKHSKAWRERACVEMGTPWMRTIAEVCEAIPPAYTAHVGAALATSLRGRSAMVEEGLDGGDRG